MDQNQKDKLLLAIKEEVIACQKCGLYKTRILPVVGQGNHSARIMFIGEAPGANESKAVKYHSNILQNVGMIL